MDGVLKLYEDCLRSEEGIRYRRSWIKDALKESQLKRMLTKLMNESNE